MIAPVSEPVVSVTFDNLGEAAQLELGMWPADVPQGQHFTVVEVLPRLLELLATRKVKATFFVEGLNCELYPDALREIATRGHELAAEVQQQLGPGYDVVCQTPEHMSR